MKEWLQMALHRFKADLPTINAVYYVAYAMCAQRISGISDRINVCCPTLIFYVCA